MFNKSLILYSEPLNNSGYLSLPVGRPCGTWMHYAMRDVKDMGQQMGYRSRMELAEKSHEHTYWGRNYSG